MSVCARCPRVLGTSCCEVKPGEQLATLTWADAERVTRATGLHASHFTEFELLDEAEATRWSLLHPQFRHYFGPRTRRLTLRRKNGACVFHGEQGCRLSEELRPLACRLYPFEVRAHGDWGLQVDRFGSVEEALAAGEHACLAVEESDSFEALRAAFGATREALEALREMLEAEAKDHGRREQALHSEDPR